MKRLWAFLILMVGLAGAVTVQYPVLVFDSIFKGDTTLPTDSQYMTKRYIDNAVSTGDTTWVNTNFFKHNRASDSTFNLFLAMATGDSAFWTLLRGRSGKITVKDTVLLPRTAYLGAVNADSGLVTKRYVDNAVVVGIDTHAFHHGDTIDKTSTLYARQAILGRNYPAALNDLFIAGLKNDSVFKITARTDSNHVDLDVIGNVTADTFKGVFSGVSLGSTCSLYTGTFIGIAASAPEWLKTGDTINVDTSLVWPSATYATTAGTSNDSSWVDATLTGMALNDTVGLIATLSRLGFSSGVISGGTVTAGSGATEGKVIITALTGAIKTTDTDTGRLKLFSLTACTTAALPDFDLSYIYVKLSGGVPKCTTTTTYGDIHITDEFPLAWVYRTGSTLDLVAGHVLVANFERRAHKRLLDKYRIEHVDGSIISAATGLHLKNTAGAYYVGMTRVDVPAWSSDTANFEHYYWDSLGTWVEVAATASIDSMRYSDGSAALQTVGVARYGVHWVYVCPQGELSVVYGSGSYTLPQADTASAPGTLPNYLAEFSVLVGKVIVARADASFTSVASAFATQFQLGTVVDHDKLGGLSGGTTDEYFHLTSAQHDTVTTGKVNAALLQGKDTTALFNAKTLQGKDTLAMHTYVGRDSALVQKGDTGVFTRLKTAFIVPPADSVQALQIFKADGTTSIFNVDSRNVRVGIGTATPTYVFDIQRNVNSNVNSTIKNSNAGSAAYASFVMFNASYYGEFGLYGTGFTPAAGWLPNQVFFNTNAPNGIHFVSQANGPIRFGHGSGGATTGASILNGGVVAVCSIAARNTEKLFVKGGVLIAGPTQIDSSLKVARLIVGDTVLIRTAGTAFAAIKRFATYADSCAGVDSIQLTALNSSGARARVITLRDSVFVKDGATVVKILSAAGKWCDVEYLGAPCSRWQVFGSN